MENVGTTLPRNVQTAASAVASQPGPLAPGSGVFTLSASPVCQPAPRVTSFLANPANQPLRSAVRLPGQPALTTGDTVFTQRVLGGGALALVVERLTSDDHNTLTLSTLSQDFPALPPLEVQAQAQTEDDPTKVLVPPTAYYHPPIAVSSRNYVFYASPPDLQCMAAYLDYCYTRAHPETGKNFEAGFLLLSGYAGISVYRVSA